MNAAIDFNVSGVEFIAAVLAAAAVFFWLPGVRLRQLLWASGNLLVLWLVLPNAASAVALAIFLGSGYVMALVLRRWSSGWLLASYLTLLVAAFVVLKQYAVLDWVLPSAIAQSSTTVLGIAIRDGVLQHLLRILGLSYMFFRQIHVLVDAAQGQIERISPWSYFNYQCNLFTILAGPIQRFEDFEEQWRALEPVLADGHELLTNCLRLELGVIKIGLIGPLFYQAWEQLQGGVSDGSFSSWKYFAQFLVVFYSFPIYLYCNFAGYCDIVIAASRFFGMKLPENFNHPYLARNVIEFWTRWHITLGTWIRDYLFMPMYKPVVERWPKAAPKLAWIFYFPAFAVAGVWHGTTLNYLYYGVWQGLGASGTKLYETLLLARLGRQGLRGYLQSPAIRFLAIFVNLHFQCVSLLIFSQRDVRVPWHMLRGLVLALTGHPH
jgi:alginate O-acetyltransferase complex protein AlgI